MPIATSDRVSADDLDALTDLMFTGAKNKHNLMDEHMGWPRNTTSRIIRGERGVSTERALEIADKAKTYAENMRARADFIDKRAARILS